jgi:hypothetical protein
VLSFGVAVAGGFLAERNVFHSFAPLAQFCQPEKQKVRLLRNRKRRTLGKNCAMSANPKCPWNYPAGQVCLLLAKVRANRGLAVKGFLPRAQHTHAPVTPHAWAHFIQAHFRGAQAARVQYDPQTSVIAGGRATCFTMPSLPVVTAAVRRAIQRHWQ